MKEIKGYTLHGDFYLSDTIIPNKTAFEALHTEEKITLPNGKIVTARVLSMEELDTIPLEERQIETDYWTSTVVESVHTHLALWHTTKKGLLCRLGGYSWGAGSCDIRLGFRNPFI